MTIRRLRMVHFLCAHECPRGFDVNGQGDYRREQGGVNGGLDGGDEKSERKELVGVSLATNSVRQPRYHFKTVSCCRETGIIAGPCPSQCIAVSVVGGL